AGQARPMTEYSTSGRFPGAREPSTGSPRLPQRIGCGSAAGFIFLQNPPLDQIGNVAQRGIRRAFFDRSPLRRGELSFKSIEQAVEHVALPLVEAGAGVPLPKARLPEHAREDAFRALEGAAETRKEPLQPWRDVEIAFLGR